MPLCELRLRPIINDDSNLEQQDLKNNECHRQGLGREPKALPRHNTFQVLFVFEESVAFKGFRWKKDDHIGKSPLY
jgi:hypothetical protein